MEPIRFLSRPEMERIHQAALRILERTGMTIDHVKALEYLRQAGCRVPRKMCPLRRAFN